ncbi:TetR family transcriptional regulator [Saccharothrix sp. ALI-22-I]|uniref:TetR/AcrR family transcriptional regulator n=1 Tax=Saccharothrix sp. ALI-22-I TaxID=1933778 RepID=UPI00097BE3B1|nr:TetR/AcrR family transcriptional regulator [Saccharothrix sp. ALI-22-I]ONI85019.1 TetR family transcriptional regulator [Saccharothrix sp. ALI-22-I]
MRADARRNQERIVAVAGDAIAEHGADASLEEIARRAGVGSATLHRHFPTRQALLEAVFRDRVEALCDQARSIAAELPPGPALAAWLRAVGRHAAANRGLAASLMRGADPSLGATCHAMITTAAEDLVTAAQRTRDVRPDVAVVDLLKLTSAISLSTEGNPTEADRLLTLALTGVRPT